MPLDPNHIHAEVPHERTVHLASKGWRYGCHSAHTGDDKPRGHDMRADDVACDGCCNRGAP